jgi:CRISPR-associated protein (TIGR02584 family)
MPLTVACQPHTYPRRILLAVAAHSPQIVTETVYALSQQTVPACMPTEVHVITTRQGEPFVRQLLCAEQPGWLARLCADYGLPYPVCDANHIHLITGADGQPLDDVRTRSDNTHAADFITRVVQQLTADPDSSLTVSLSGGRRTMTFYAGYALSLFGRAQDRLTHVLVDEEYFFHREFFYPPPRSVWVVREDGSGFDASKVEVTLAEIPFVRLREGLPQDLLQGSSSFSDTIAAAQRRLNPVQVLLDWKRAALMCGGIPVLMQPVQLAFYAWMLERLSRGLPPVHWTTQETPDLAEQFLLVYQRLHGQTGSYEQVASALRDGITKAWFDERKSNTHKALKKALGSAGAEMYLLQPHGSKPRTHFGLALPLDVLGFS